MELERAVRKIAKLESLQWNYTVLDSAHFLTLFTTFQVLYFSYCTFHTHVSSNKDGEFGGTFLFLGNFRILIGDTSGKKNFIAFGTSGMKCWKNWVRDGRTRMSEVVSVHLLGISAIKAVYTKYISWSPFWTVIFLLSLEASCGASPPGPERTDPASEEPY